MVDQSFILAPATESVNVRVSLEPVYNILNSMLLLAGPEERFGFNEWVTRTAAALSPERAHTNRLLMKVFFDSVIPDEALASFPAYMDALAAQDPISLRDGALGWCLKPHEDIQPPDKETLLNDKQVFLNYIEQLFTAKGEKEYVFERGYFDEGHALLQDPPALKTLILDHLRSMWREVLEPEWKRVLPMLQESVEAFQQLDYSGMTALQAVRVVTGRDLTGIWEDFSDSLVFIPSAHIGPYVTGFHLEEHRSGKPGISHIAFGARLPEGARLVSPALSRSELLVRLNALADDTRLMILELLTQHSELCAQDIIEKLDLSQSAASRHLRQLTATGYLLERRREVAKCYSLNPQRVDDTLRALKRFLKAK